jgi:hypothetical protein
VDTRRYLDAVFGTIKGNAHLEVGREPYINSAGKYKHEKWEKGKTFRWPDQAEALVTAIEAEAEGTEPADVYVGPYLTHGSKRAQGAAVARPIVKADIDSGNIDLNRLRALHGWAVGSGTPGNGHGYLNLEESVSANVHEALCRGLGADLGAKDSKVSDNDVLRPPGTFNWKAHTRQSGGPSPVEFLIEPSGYAWPVAKLAAELGVNLETIPTLGPTRKPKTAAVVEPIADIPASVRAALAITTGDRSADTMRIVGASMDAGLTLGQTRAVIDFRNDLAGRLAQRHDDDVQACWDKAALERIPVAETAAGRVLGGKTYVTKEGGLLAATLFSDVKALGPLAAGLDGHVWAYLDGVWVPGQRELEKRVVRLLGQKFRPAYSATVLFMLMAQEPYINDEPVTE